MTKHMIRIYAEGPKNVKRDEVRLPVGKWAGQHKRWSDDPSKSPMQVDLTPSGVGYAVGNYRFYTTDDKVVLITDVADRLQNVVSWYRIGYHLCDHDEDLSTGCSWDDTAEYGPVPDEIPSLL